MSDDSTIQSWFTAQESERKVRTALGNLLLPLFSLGLKEILVVLFFFFLLLNYLQSLVFPASVLWSREHRKVKELKSGILTDCKELWPYSDSSKEKSDRLSISSPFSLFEFSAIKLNEVWVYEFIFIFFWVNFIF